MPARLGRRLRSLRQPVSAEKVEELSRQVAAAEAMVAARRGRPGRQLPRSAGQPVARRTGRGHLREPGGHRGGETNSGKTTQLPKICSTWAAGAA